MAFLYPRYVRHRAWQRRRPQLGVGAALNELQPLSAWQPPRTHAMTATTGGGYGGKPQQQPTGGWMIQRSQQRPVTPQQAAARAAAPAQQQTASTVLQRATGRRSFIAPQVARAGATTARWSAQPTTVTPTTLRPTQTGVHERSSPTAEEYARRAMEELFAGEPGMSEEEYQRRRQRIEEDIAQREAEDWRRIRAEMAARGLGSSGAYFAAQRGMLADYMREQMGRLSELASEAWRIKREDINRRIDAALRYLKAQESLERWQWEKERAPATEDEYLAELRRFLDEEVAAGRMSQEDADEIYRNAALEIRAGVTETPSEAREREAKEAAEREAEEARAKAVEQWSALAEQLQALYAEIERLGAPANVLTAASALVLAAQNHATRGDAWDATEADELLRNMQSWLEEAKAASTYYGARQREEEEVTGSPLPTAELHESKSRSGRHAG